jgi:DNA polymerase-3 subunit beta
MKVTIKREQLLKSLNTALHGIANKTPIPVMSNVKMELNEKGLFLSTTNNELSVKTMVPYMIGSTEVITNYREGAALVDARTLTEVVRRMEGNEINIELVDNVILQVDDGRSNFKLNSVKVEEFPLLDFEPSGVNFTLPVNEFVRLVDQTAFAASQKEQRPVLTAVNLSAHDQILTAVATDSARLARKMLPLENNVVFSANVPAKFLVEIARMAEGEEEVEIAVSEKKMLFAFDNTIVNSRLISGEYPATHNIVPRSYNYFLEVNAEELLKAMDRVALLSGERENVVKLAMTESEVTISTKSSQKGSSIDRLSTFQFTGEPLQISFNAAFVAAAVKACRSQDVTLSFLGEMKPISIRDMNDDTQIQIVTPVRTY